MTERPTKEEVARFLEERGLMVVPRDELQRNDGFESGDTSSWGPSSAKGPLTPPPGTVAPTAPAPQGPLTPPQGTVMPTYPGAPVPPALDLWRRGGGGGAAFTGVRAGTYLIGGGSITVNGKGQILNITPGSGGGGLEVQDEGLTVVPLALVMDFRGAGVSVTQIGANTARVDIPGGGVPPPTNQFFQDDVTTDIVVGDTSDGCIVVDASISKVNGESTCFRFMFGVSATGTGFDCLQADSDAPITDIEPQAVLVGPNVVLRLVGSGSGVDSGISYRISTLPRLLP